MKLLSRVVMAPRPGRIVAEVTNPGMGTPEYRATQEFFAKCNEVREALAAGSKKPAMAQAGEVQ